MFVVEEQEVGDDQFYDLVLLSYYDNTILFWNVQKNNNLSEIGHNHLQVIIGRKHPSLYTFRIFNIISRYDVNL